MGFQTEICPILRVFWSILVRFWLYLPMSSSKTQTLHLEKSIFHKYWLFCSKFFAFTFDLCAFCLLSVIRKQQLKQCNYSVDQSVLLTGFRTDFTSSVWNFCHWVADVPPRETSPAAKSEEKRMFSQAKRPAKIWNLANAKLQTRNCKLRFAVCLMLKVSNIRKNIVFPKHLPLQ